MPDPLCSAEARVLFEPDRVFREKAGAAPERRRPWLPRTAGLLFAIGVFVSFLASGRLTARLILDGAVSFGFIPAIEVAALAIVMRAAGRRFAAGSSPSFGERLDRYFIGHAPWFIWLLVFGAIFGVVAPRENSSWIRPALFAAAIPALWSCWIDFHFFREVVKASSSRAGVMVVLSRAIGWSAAIGLFLGIAIWSEYMPQLALWLAR